jgi:hypothetical protein
LGPPPFSLPCCAAQMLVVPEMAHVSMRLCPRGVLPSAGEVAEALRDHMTARLGCRQVRPRVVMFWWAAGCGVV